MSATSLALFDFDGTITTKDTLPEIIKYIKGNSQYLKGLLSMSPTLLKYKARLISNSKAKEHFLGYYFQGMELKEFQNKCDSFAREILPSLIRNNALAAIKDHQDKGNRVIVISASCENWIAAWSDSLGIDLIGTRLEIRDDVLTGRFNGKNCYGAEKVERLKEMLDPATFSPIFAYGDSKGDRELLELAQFPFYRTFDHS